MSYSFNEIHNIHQEITLQINETIDNAMMIASAALFSFWLLWGLGIMIILTNYSYPFVNSWLLILWIFGFIIILIPWILRFLLKFIFWLILVNKHYKIVVRLKEEFNDIDIFKQIPDILNSAQQINQTIKKEGLFFYFFIYFWLYLERRWIAMSLKWNQQYSKEMNRTILANTQLNIERKRKLLLALIGRIKILEVDLVKKILIDLRSDLLIRLDEQKKSLESAKSEVESNIKWSNDLEQVSEIQKIRLDRQIEQFEELQKLLT